jgi:hypothetical protein
MSRSCLSQSSPISWGARQNSAASAPRQTHRARVTKPTSIYDTPSINTSRYAPVSVATVPPTRATHTSNAPSLYPRALSRGSTGLMTGTCPCQPWALNRGVTVVKAQASSRQQRATGKRSRAATLLHPHATTPIQNTKHITNDAKSKQSTMCYYKLDT